VAWSRPVSHGVLLCTALVVGLALAYSDTPAASARAAPRVGQASAAVPATAPDWLLRLNEARSWASLPAVAENPVWSQACWLHARYMSENDWIGHTEDPGNPWYTAEGAAAAGNSNVTLGTGGVSAVEGLLTMPFHALLMLNPALNEVGFGSFKAPGKPAAAALDVWSGRGVTPAASIFPVTWPGPGSEVTLVNTVGEEYPNPLAGLRGLYWGLPILVQFAEAPSTTSTSLSSGGQELSHALITATSYSSPSADEQELGRAILDSENAIIIMPQEPLKWGSSYRVSVTEGGRAFSWSFRVATAPTVSFKTSRRTAKVGQAVTLSGTVQHAITGHSTVGIYLNNGPRQYRRATVKLAGSGHFSWTFKARTIGKTYYVAIYDLPGTWDWWSNSLGVTVRK
jgi:uncharacterized protein YkwD